MLPSSAVWLLRAGFDSHTAELGNNMVLAVPRRTSGADGRVLMKLGLRDRDQAVIVAFAARSRRTPCPKMIVQFVPPTSIRASVLFRVRRTADEPP